MTTFQITLPKPLQQFVLNRVAELGLERPDQYLEQLIEEEQRKNFDDYYMAKVQEALDRNEWIPEKDFWKLVDEDTQSRRSARKIEAIR